MKILSDRSYTKDHEWVQVTEQLARVGITDFAQSELGDVVFIDPPKMGKKLAKGDVLCVVESTKAASDVYAPVSGEVVEVNPALSGSPELLNAAPYTDGWIAVIKIAQPSEAGELLSDVDYAALIGGKK